MSKHRNENDWSEFKGRAQRQWDNVKHQSKHHFTHHQNDSDEDFDDSKTKKQRADKQMLELKSVLQLMSADTSKNI